MVDALSCHSLNSDTQGNRKTFSQQRKERKSVSKLLFSSVLSASLPFKPQQPWKVSVCHYPRPTRSLEQPPQRLSRDAGEWRFVGEAFISGTKSSVPQLEGYKMLALLYL